MKLTQRQLDKISGLISEEAKVRKELHEGMYESRKQSLMSESLMFEGTVDINEDPEGFVQKFVEDIENDVAEYSREFVGNPAKNIVPINRILYKSIADYMTLSGVVGENNRAMSASDWEDELEMSDIYEFQMDLQDMVFKAIQVYAKQIMETAVGIASQIPRAPAASSTERDLETRYSEFE